MPCRTIVSAVSDTSKNPQNDVGSCLGLYVALLMSGTIRSCRITTTGPAIGAAPCMAGIVARLLAADVGGVCEVYDTIVLGILTKLLVIIIWTAEVCKIMSTVL